MHYILLEYSISWYAPKVKSKTHQNSLSTFSFLQMLTSSGTSIVMPQASTLSQRQERLERYKDSFDLDIFEQVKHL